MNFETKFNPGQTAYFLTGTTVKKTTVSRIFVTITKSAGSYQAEELVSESDDTKAYYPDGDVKDNRVFATKEELFIELEKRINKK